MEALVRGDAVIVPFPFSDLSAIKRRSALVIANFQGPDIIRCQIKKSIIQYRAGTIKEEKLKEVKSVLISLLEGKL
jgi:mRNA interferase MazF